MKGLLQFVTFMRFPHPFSLFSRFVICILCPYLEDKRTLTEINDVVGSHFFLLGVKYEMFPAKVSFGYLEEKHFYENAK